jgi:hypothetical protein
MRLVLSIALVLATVAGVAAAAARHQQPARTGPLELVAKAGKTVTATGAHITGLAPHASKRMVFTFRNTNPYTVKVTPVKVAVARKTSAAGCPGSFVTATAPKKAIRIAKTKTASLPVTVTMSPRATDPCQGVRFTISVTYRAVKG